MAKAQQVSMPSNASGTTVAITGPVMSGGYGMISNYISVGGFKPNQSVKVTLAMAPNCSSMGCSSTVSIQVGTGSSAADLYGSGGNCPAQAATTADANGNLLIYSDPSGTNGNDNVIELIAQ